MVVPDLPEELSIDARAVYKEYRLGASAISLKDAVMGRRLGRPTVHAVNDVTISVRRGEVLGLVGRNGSGKSTLIRLLAGIYQPTAGVIQVRGRTTALIELGAGFDPRLSGRENIFLNASGHGMTRVEIEPLVGSIEEVADIGRFIDFPIETYSSGMRARLGFAVATALEPDVLLADEITAVGDVTFAERCFAHFDAVAASGTTVVLASHNLGRLIEVADRVLWLEGGAVSDLGDPGTVVENYRTWMRSNAPGSEAGGGR